MSKAPDISRAEVEPRILVPDMEQRCHEPTIDHQTPSIMPEGVLVPDNLPSEWQDRLRWSKQNCKPGESEPDMPTTLVHGRVFVDSTLIEYTGEFPEEPSSGVLNLIMGGFGGFKRTSRALRHAAAVRGEASISADQIRADKRSPVERLLKPQKAHIDVIEAVAYDVASRNDLKHVPNAQVYGDFMSFSAIPHSMAGLSAMRFAARHPDKVLDVVEIQAVGKKSPTIDQLLFSLPQGIIDSTRHEFLPYVLGDAIDRTPRNVGRFIHYYGRNPLRTIGEMASCIRESNIEQTEKVRASGRFVAYLAGQYDILVPRTAHIAELVDLYRVMPLGHLAPQHRAGKVADHIIDAHQQFRLTA